MYDDLPIVDAHHHLWDLEGNVRYPWLSQPDPHHSYMGDNSALRRSYLPQEYRRDTALHNVVATVHIEAECDRSQQVAETRWLTEMAARHGMPNAIVAHAWIDTPDAEEILAQHKQFPLVRGIRTKPIISEGPDKSVRGQPRSMQDPKWRNGPVAAGEARPVMGPARGVVAPGGGRRGRARASRPKDGSQSHRLSAGPFARGARRSGAAAWRRWPPAPTCACKISGLVVKGEPWTLAANSPIILDAIRIFGVDRCMFASNFPSTASRAAGTTSTASSSGRWRTSRSPTAASCSPRTRRGSIASPI